MVETRGEVPGPRVGHASVGVGNVLIVWGGDTKSRPEERQDDGLYLLNLSESFSGTVSAVERGTKLIEPFRRVQALANGPELKLWDLLPKVVTVTLQLWLDLSSSFSVVKPMNLSTVRTLQQSSVVSRTICAGSICKNVSSYFFFFL